MVQLHHPLLQLPRLVGCKAEVAHVVGAVLLRFIVAQLGLHGVGAQEGVSDEGAGQAARQDVVPQLQAQVVPAREEEEGSIELRWLLLISKSWSLNMNLVLISWSL